MKTPHQSLKTQNSYVYLTRQRENLLLRTKSPFELCGKHCMIQFWFDELRPCWWFLVEVLMTEMSYQCMFSVTEPHNPESETNCYLQAEKSILGSGQPNSQNKEKKKAKIGANNLLSLVSFFLDTWFENQSTHCMLRGQSWNERCRCVGCHRVSGIDRHTHRTYCACNNPGHWSCSRCRHRCQRQHLYHCGRWERKCTQCSSPSQLFSTLESFPEFAYFPRSCFCSLLSPNDHFVVRTNVFWVEPTFKTMSFNGCISGLILPAGDGNKLPATEK